jgi:lactoylglutathione lyase
MPIRWTHVVLKVAELERSVAFYGRTCGLDVVHDGRPRGHTVWLGRRPEGDALPSFVLVLYQTAIDARVDHLGFQVGSRAEVDAIAAAARTSGALVQPPWDGGGALGYMASIRDPDGHVVEFTCGQPIAGL